MDMDMSSQQRAHAQALALTWMWTWAMDMDVGMDLERPEADEALALLACKIELAVARREEVTILGVPFEARDVAPSGLLLR